MNEIIEKFTLECRTNKSGKLKRFKPNFINRESYKFWKADSNVMVRDAILANKVSISYPRQLEMIHGAIERILKSYVIKQYGIELLVHETRTIYDAIKHELGKEISREDYATLKLRKAIFNYHRPFNTSKKLIEIKKKVQSKFGIRYKNIYQYTQFFKLIEKMKTRIVKFRIL
ncbi:MAG: hypothetical protein E7E64_03495 [Clostridium celatum]|nr:hypothetical protein [Clostridium celatum]MDU4978466.1 hypothetical protein [Clostridium celatum]